MSKKWGIEYGALQGFLEELRRLEADTKGTVEKALVATQDYIADQADKHTEDKYLPAKGEFKSNPSQIKSAIIRDHKVEWELSKAQIRTGLSAGKALYSIFLLNGTQTMEPAKGLKNAVQGAKAKKAVAEIQKDIFYKACEEAHKNG